MRAFKSLLLLALFALIALVAASLTAQGYEEYTDNENPTSAKWIDLPKTMGPVHMWKSSGGNINTDWWRFNASEGQHLEIRFRKYTENPEVPGLPAYTYYIKYEVAGPYVSSRTIYEYTQTYPRQGDPREYHRRDTFSYVIPKNMQGIYFIHLYVDPPGNENRDWAFYWLNVTITDPPSLDSQRSYTSPIATYGNYNINFNFDDYYTINLTSSKVNGDFVHVNVQKAHANRPVWIEAWERIPFGSGQRDQMVNRTYSNNAANLNFYFTADYTGMYYIRVYWYFWYPYATGSTTYTLTVSLSKRGLEGDDTAQNGTYIPKAMILRRVPIEMGYDTHDWYRAQLLDGDQAFKVTVDLNDPNLDGHAYKLVVYDSTGLIMWWESNRKREGDNWIYRPRMEVPPPGTPTIFDKDEIYYIRVSVNVGECGGSVRGFRETYDITIKLSNRAPVLVEPFKDFYTWNEDTELSIELDSHFTDADGDSMEYTIFNKSVGWEVDLPGITSFGWLNITPPANFNGQVLWRLRANDEGQTDPRHNIYIDLDLRVKPVADMPISNGTKQTECDEEGSVTWSLTKLFYDVDTGPGGVLTYNYFDNGQTDVEVDLDEDTGEVTLSPAPDVEGIFLFDFFVEDDAQIPVYGKLKLTVNGINDAPRVNMTLPLIEMEEGGPARELDLDLYFFDVDGDELVYFMNLPPGFTGDLDVYYKNNVQTESRIIIKWTDPHYYGAVTVNITAQDPSDTVAYQDLRVRIYNVPNAPEIDAIPEGNPSDIFEGESIEFKITDIVDEDEAEFGLHTYKWVFDGLPLENHNESTFVYVAGYEDAGSHSVKVEVTDPAGLMATTVPLWSFNVKDLNRDPSVSVMPADTEISEDEEIILEATFSDPDGGDELTVTWWLIGDPDKNLGTGRTISTKLPPGTQTIEVVVDDGKGGESKDTIIFTVKKVEEESNLLLILGILAVIIIVVVVAVAMYMMKRKRPVAIETKIDIDSLEQSYEDQFEGYKRPDDGF
jgi:hypothetical protein